jgi:hypothetical protein
MESSVFRSWQKPEMDALEASLRKMLRESRVPASEQSSILHSLASDADSRACLEEEPPSSA